MTKTGAATSINDKPSDRKHHCLDYLLSTLKTADHALTYADFGTLYKYGTLRNKMSILIEQGKTLSLPKEWPKRFILPKWAHRPEYACVQRNDKRGTAGRFDFVIFGELEVDVSFGSSQLEVLLFSVPVDLGRLRLGLLQRKQKLL
jgi:hypothetical protein